MKQPNQKADVKLKSLQNRPGTEAGILREDLRELEIAISRLSDLTTGAALDLLLLFDNVDKALDKLQEGGMNLNSELGQFETISTRFRKKSRLFIRKVGGVQTLSDARVSRKPEPEQWWWFIDERLARYKRQRIKRSLRTGVVIAGVLIIAVVIYNKYFAPDPNVVASYTLRQTAETALAEGNFEDALTQIREAITFTPEDPVLSLLEGVILDALDRPKEARISFALAKDQFITEDLFYNERTRVYLMLSDVESALADIESAIAINPDSAIAYLSQGQAFELMGDFNRAVESYKNADSLAQKADNIQLQAIIRINLSNAYQRIGLPAVKEEDQGK